MTTDNELRKEAEASAEKEYPYVTDDMPTRVHVLHNRLACRKGYLLGHAAAEKKEGEAIEAFNNWVRENNITHGADEPDGRNWFWHFNGRYSFAELYTIFKSQKQEG